MTPAFMCTSSLVQYKVTSHIQAACCLTCVLALDHRVLVSGDHCPNVDMSLAHKATCAHPSGVCIVGGEEHRLPSAPGGTLIWKSLKSIIAECIDAMQTRKALTKLGQLNECVAWMGSAEDFLRGAEYQSSPLQLTEPFSLELQKSDRMADIPSHDAPILLQPPADMLPGVASAHLLPWPCEGWLDIQLDGVTAATTVVLHVEAATHGVGILLGEHLSKAGLLAKHQRIRVQVSKRVYGVSAHNGRWRSDLTAVQRIVNTR